MAHHSGESQSASPFFGTARSRLFPAVIACFGGLLAGVFLTGPLTHFEEVDDPIQPVSSESVDQQLVLEQSRLHFLQQLDQVFRSIEQRLMLNPSDYDAFEEALALYSTYDRQFVGRFADKSSLGERDLVARRIERIAELARLNTNGVSNASTE